MKDYARQFYASNAWATCRAAYRESVGGLCERCYEKGMITPGEIVHHKVHLTPENINNPEVTLSFDNLQLLCRECHAEIHKGKEIRYKVDEYGSITILK